jgi:flagellar biosynthesis anti-sigma factor FlgM
MRIETKPVVPVSNEPKSGQPAASSAPPAPAAALTTPAAVVSLSSAGTSATAQIKIKDMPDPKVQARIAQIRQQLQTGSYPIDLDELAARIADDELARKGD